LACAADGYQKEGRVNKRKPTVISLFTGAGGLDLGFHAAGLSTAVAVEMDARCCETLELNKRRGYSWEVIHAPVEEVSSKTLLSAAKLRPGEADALIGGPPCQPFSKSGYWSRGDSGRLKDPRANTLAEFIRVLRDTQPKTFLLENVTGLAYTGKEEGLRYLLEEIDEINSQTGTDYRVSAKVLNAAWYGVPQTRERIILVGSREGRTFRFPEARFYDPEVRNGELLPGREAYRTAWDALGDLGDPEDFDDTCMRGRWADLLPSIPEGLNYLHHTDRGEGLPIFGWRRRYWSFLLKLSKRRAAWTLTAQPGPAIGPFHWENRRLARKELKRLQTFPDSYYIAGNLSEVQRQLGNAVPSALAEVLALEIRRQLLDDAVTSDQPTLIPPRRLPVPKAESVLAVPKKYRSLIGSHDPHPGTGLGYAAQRRAGAYES
jgi:DNA (cytosine-5)-methyltransferase 1